MIYTDILTYWFITKKNKWFTKDNSIAQKELDNEIKTKFGLILKEIEIFCELYFINNINNKYKNWIDNPHGILAIIVVLDQFSRHIYRDRTNKINLYYLTRNDTWALHFSEIIFNNQWESLLTDSQFMIACMPFRHSANPPLIKENKITDRQRINYLKFVMNEIDKRGEIKKSNETLKNFWNVTNNRLSKIFQSMDNNFIETDILDKNCFSYFNKRTSRNVTEEPIFKEILNFKKKHLSNSNYVFVSLSGGVDSMLISHLFNCIPNTIVVAIHIDYGNRMESSAEAEFIKQWCERQAPPIIFEIERIDNSLRRNNTPKEIYEKQTKTIRFNFYKKILNKYPEDNKCIMLGHIYNDIQENVLSNINKKTSIYDISGMYESNVIDGVCIKRPFLNIRKKDIFNTAHRLFTPYMKDTTPRFCVRGMIRHELMPLLTKIYGNGFPDSLNYLANQSNELTELMSKMVWKNKLNNIGGYFGQI